MIAPIASDQSGPEAFIVVRTPSLSWGIPSRFVTRIVRGDEAQELEAITVPDELAERSGTADVMHALILKCGDHERAIRLASRLDLISAEGLTIEPLPALCETGASGTLTIKA